VIRVSIVVPAYNEELLLPACLDSLAQQDYAGDIEVIVVDNASDDRTAEVATRRGVMVVSESLRGYSSALARGFKSATGEIVATTDADTVVPRNWISLLVREYESHPDVVAVGGEIVFRDANRAARVFTQGILPLLVRLDRSNPAGAHLWGANFSVRRAAFDAAGGWLEEFNLQADTELSERLRRFGRVVLLDNLPVYTSSRRWNRRLLPSLALYASNFVWFQLWRRPLWRSFPNIREVNGGTRPSVAATRRTPPIARPRRLESGSRLRAGALAGFLAVLVGCAGYEALTPWSSAFGKTYWTGAVDRRVVALTFDDGPDEPYTSQLLDILRTERVHATFFLIGANVRRNPGVAARIAREGHVIGNHSDSHPLGLALEPAFRIQNEVELAEKSIRDATHVTARYFRPPQGIRSPWLAAVLARDSLVDVTWDDAPRDWQHATPSVLAARTVAQAHPGAIILLHDGLNTDPSAERSATIQAVPLIIHRLRALGYGFVTIAELLGDTRSLPRAAQSSPGVALGSQPGRSTSPRAPIAMQACSSDK